MNSNRLTVCIVTYERPTFLRRCLDGLRALMGQLPEVVVVDASREQTRADVESAYPGVLYVHAPQLAGWMTRSRNEALRWARGDIIAFIDDDVVVRPGWAQALVGVFADSAVAAVGGRTCNGIVGEEDYPLPIGTLRPDGTLTEGFAADIADAIRIDHGIGANMSFRRSVLADLGGFRDDYPGTALREDTDIFLRVRASGGVSLFAPQVVVDHLPAPHVRGARFDTRYKLYGRRNHVVLLARDQGLRSPMLRRWVLSQLRAVLRADGLRAQAHRLVVTAIGIGWGFVAALGQARWGPTPCRRVDEQGDDLRRVLTARPPAPLATALHTAPSGRPATFALVIPTYRRPEMVLQAVDSALSQARPFDQIIVIADGLDDPAVPLLAELPVDVVSIPRGREAVARNTGVEMASTDWVCFLDDDDLLHPRYLSRVAAEVEADPSVLALNTKFWSFASTAGPEDDFSAGSLSECLERSVGVAPKNSRDYMQIEGRSFDLLLERMRGAMGTSAVRRDVLLAAGGFPVEMGPVADWAMYVNVARLTEWRTILEPLAYSRDHPGTVTRSGSPALGLAALRAARSFWRPSALPTPPHRPLDAYRLHYRHVLDWALAACWRARDFRTFRFGLVVGRDVLVRRRDLVRAARPPSLRPSYWAGRLHARR